MTKKVLGSDPFSREGEGEEAPTSDAGRPSKRPGAKTSKRPGAKTSKRPSAKASAKDEVTHAPKAPKVPAEALEAMDATAEAPAPPESEAAIERAASAPPSAPTKSNRPEEDSAIDEVGAEASVTTARASDAPDNADASADESASPSATEADGSIEDKIRALESQLDVLLARAGRERPSTDSDEATSEPRSERANDGSVEVRDAARGPIEEEPQDSASDIASGEFYARQWGRVALRDRAEDVDEFGLDEQFLSMAKPVIDLLYTKWWRVETHGIENVPDAGRVILCANHAGAVPYDGLMLAAALRREHPAQRPLRWLADDFVFHFPFMGVALNRLGAVRACQENAERLLRSSTVVGVFPEGVKGVSKSYRERYQLQRFGRGGHIKLALRTRTPIVPVAIVGSEETHPMLPTGPLAKLLNLPIVPVTPTFPWFGALGLVPLPAKWSISFLPPISVDGYDDKSADDELLVGRLNEKVRAAIQDELDVRVRNRRSLFR